MTTKQSLRDDLRILKHPPGIRRTLEEEIVKERKRSETRKAAMVALAAIERAIVVEAKRTAGRREELSRIRSSRGGQLERLVTTFTGRWDD